MTKADPLQTQPTSTRPDAIDTMAEGEFVKGWKAIVGEPPAIMLDSHADMVKVLVESVPVATPDPTDTLGLSDCPENEGKTQQWLWSLRSSA